MSTLTPDQRLWISDVEQRSEARAKSTYIWVAQLDEVCASLCDEEKSQDYPARWMELALFYVRLFGVVDEMPDEMRTAVEYRSQNAAGFAVELARRLPHERAQLVRNLDAIDALFIAASELRAALSDDELVVLWFFRNQNAHVYVKSEGLRLTKSGQLSHRREVSGRELTVAEIDAARNRLAAIHSDEFQGARAIALRIRNRVSLLRSAYEALLTAH